MKAEKSISKEEFLKKLDSAKAVGDCFAVIVEAPDLEGYEMISNPPGNLAVKREYYNESYNENMELKAFPKIRIVGAGAIDGMDFPTCW